MELEGPDLEYAIAYLPKKPEDDGHARVTNIATQLLAGSKHLDSWIAGGEGGGLSTEQAIQGARKIAKALLDQEENERRCYSAEARHERLDASLPSHSFKSALKEIVGGPGLKRKEEELTKWLKQRYPKIWGETLTQWRVKGLTSSELMRCKRSFSKWRENHISTVRSEAGTKRQEAKSELLDSRQEKLELTKAETKKLNAASPKPIR